MILFVAGAFAGCVINAIVLALLFASDVRSVKGEGEQE